MSVTFIIDIGSSSVGAAFVLVSKDIVPKILWSTRLTIALPDELGSSRSLAAVTATLELVMNTVVAEHIIPHKTHIIFSSPWCLSETKITKIEHDLPVLVTHHLIERLAKETNSQFVEDPKSNDREVVEHRIIQMKLNGYNTSDPYGKKAKSVEVAFFVSTIAKDFLESVRRIVGKHFHLRNNEVSSFSLAAFMVICGILPAEKDFLIVDVRGEVTDLSLVTDGVLIKSLSFPQGKDALIKAIFVGLGQSTTAALSLLRTTFRGHSEPATVAEVAKFTEGFKQTWREAYTKTLQEIAGTSEILPTVFLMADQDTEMFFENILNEINNNSSLHLLKHLKLRSFIDSASVGADEFLALESIFATMV